MARQKGFEPLAYCLEGSCSILLSYWRRSRLRSKLERVKGIEPSYPAWKAGVLPLNYTRKLKDFIIQMKKCQGLSKKFQVRTRIIFRLPKGWEIFQSE